MLVFDKKQFYPAKFNSEEEIEYVVTENAAAIFGKNALYFPKRLIKTSDGAGTIPDGFVIDVENNRWFVVEAETSKHPVWEHIAKQVSKQLAAAKQPKTKKLLVNLAVMRAQKEPAVGVIFEKAKIHPMDIRQVLDDIVADDPVIAMPIDGISDDLKDWASPLKVKLWLLKKYVEVGNPKNIIYEFPDNGQPVLDTVEDPPKPKETAEQYNIPLVDLIAAGLLKDGETLTMSYKRKKKEPRTYEGVLSGDGSITVLGKKFSSLSCAAVHAIQDAGSNRETVNGWTSWRNSQGLTLFMLRNQLLNKK